MPINTQEKIHQIALSRVKGIGPALFKKLLMQFGSAQAVFNKTHKDLLKISGSSQRLAHEILKKDTLHAATAIFSAHQKANIQLISSWDASYPMRLKQIPDAPPLLYFQGNGALNAAKVVSIVGTRNATAYGKKVVERLIWALRTTRC